MAGRVPCGVCNLQNSSPNNFLLVCACGTACHHRCLKPPMAHSSLLVMIDAFNRSIHEKSIRSWRCTACTGTTSKLMNQSLPPVSAQLPTLVDKKVRYNPGCHDTNIASGRVREWQKYAPAHVKPSQPRLHIDSLAAAWPPVRHKNKTHTLPSIVNDIGEQAREDTSLKVNVAPTKQVESRYRVKPFVRSLASPATSRRSVQAAPLNDSPSGDSPPRGVNPVPPLVTVSSPPEKLFPIHDQIITEPHLLPTPRSLSPSHHPVLRSVLDDVVARLQQHHQDHLQPPKFYESTVKLPKIAKWFKDFGTNLISTGTRDKRKRWKTPNAKAMMVGLSEGWSFVGAHVRVAR